MEKAVFKATNKDCVTPKKKHVDRLVQMTWMEPPASMAELFVVIEGRFSEPSWVISFKALILIHLLMQEGEPATVFDYLSRNSNVLDLHQFRDKNGTRSFDQSKNIRLYAHYLIEKVNCYKDTQVDFVRDKYPSKTQIYGEGKLNIQRLLTEISYIQRQIYVLLKAKFFIDTVDNEVTFTAFRLLIRDLLKLFQAMNVGVIKMLKSYFIISYDDMRRSLELYKRFVKITDRVTDYLENGRQLQASFGINIPLLNHAPVSLAISLEEYLQTPEARLPVAEKIKNQKGTSGPPTLPASMAKNATAPTTFGGKPASKEPASPTKPMFHTMPRKMNAPPSSLAPPASSNTLNRAATMSRSSTQPAPSSSTPAAAEKAESQRDLIDFFSSIEHEVIQPATLPTSLMAIQPTPSPSNPFFDTSVQFQPSQQTQQLALPAPPTPSTHDYYMNQQQAQPENQQQLVLANSGSPSSRNPFTLRQSMYSPSDMNGLGNQAATSNNFMDMVPSTFSNPGMGQHRPTTAYDISSNSHSGTHGNTDYATSSATLSGTSYNPFTQRQSMFVANTSNTNTYTSNPSGSGNPFATDPSSFQSFSQTNYNSHTPSNDPFAAFGLDSMLGGGSGPTQTKVTTTAIMSESYVKRSQTVLVPAGTTAALMNQQQQLQQQHPQQQSFPPSVGFGNDATQPLFATNFDDFMNSTSSGGAAAPNSTTHPFHSAGAQPTPAANLNPAVNNSNPFGFAAFH